MNNEVGTTGYILTLLTTIFAFITGIISLGMIIIILYHLHNQRRHLKREEKISLLLHSHIYSYIFLFIVVFISVNIQTLIGEVYDKSYDSSWCIFQGYCLMVSACVMYYGFVVQGVFRLFRIVYSKYRQLQSYWIFAVSAPVAIILASILVSPIIIWHDIVYLPNEHFCFMALMKVRCAVWAMCTCYMIPQICLFMIQIRITVFLRQQSSNLSIAIKQKQQRDLEVIRRIFINIGVSIITGLPAIVVSLMALITGASHPLTQRIIFITTAISFAVLSIEMIFITPQLKRLILRRRQRNQVTVMEHGIQMNNISMKR